MSKPHADDWKVLATAILCQNTYVVMIDDSVIAMTDNADRDTSFMRFVDSMNDI